MTTGGGVRLDRWLAQAGVGSRAESSKRVRRGEVTVDGETVTAPERRIEATARVAVGGLAVEPLPDVLVYHKPVGLLVTMDDPWGRATIASVLGPRLAPNLHPVGRLDADTSGLLLFVSDGQLTQRLLHPRRGVEKEYLAEVSGEPPSDLAERLAAGVPTAEGTHMARLVSSEGPKVRLVVTEGKHRMVRRMLANLGLPVTRLHRLRLGQVELGDLAEGALRPPTEQERQWLEGVRGG